MRIVCPLRDELLREATKAKLGGHINFVLNVDGATIRGCRKEASSKWSRRIAQNLCTTTCSETSLMGRDKEQDNDIQGLDDTCIRRGT